jgi:hypothetical protein
MTPARRQIRLTTERRLIREASQRLLAGTPGAVTALSPSLPLPPKPPYLATRSTSITPT